MRGSRTHRRQSVGTGCSQPPTSGGIEFGASPARLALVTQPGIPNDLVFSTSCFGPRLRAIEDQAFSAVAMGFRRLELGLSDQPPDLSGWEESARETGVRVDSVVVGALKPRAQTMTGSLLGSSDPSSRELALNSARRHIRLAQSLASAGGRPARLRGRGFEAADARPAELSSSPWSGPTRMGSSEVQGRVRDFVGRVQQRGQRQLEHFCRSLHTLRGRSSPTRTARDRARAALQRSPELRGRAVGAGRSRRTARSATGTTPVGSTSEASPGCRVRAPGWTAFAGRMLGCHLQDATSEEAELPPGSGEVDFRMVQGVHAARGRPRGRAEPQARPGRGARDGAVPARTGVLRGAKGVPERDGSRLG